MEGFESIKLFVSEAVEHEWLMTRLVAFGYNRCKRVAEEGDFSVIGENIVVFPFTFEYPVRIELAGSRIERIRSVDNVSYETFAEHTSVIILPIKGVLRRRRIVRRKYKFGEDLPIDNFVDIDTGDHVVHVDHGIGKYLGLEGIEQKSGEVIDHLVIEYIGGDKLYAPFSDLDKVQKYIGIERKTPKMYRLGSKMWNRQKHRASKGIAKVALEILDIQAKRQGDKGFSFSRDTDWQHDLEKSFPYKDTPDQRRSTDEVKRDMESGRPMDRLLCGDVGYGKTEVALRAAFKAVMDNKQVAILVPTTILAEQHLYTFTERMKEYPVHIEDLSRFKTKKEQEGVIRRLAEGAVDIIIGTQRLLSKDIAFKDLGLAIIDEEQRFGVRHKEHLKRLRYVVDVLTLTATPIPRTLYLALMGGKDISAINTPPLERRAVETRVTDYDEDLIEKALKRELARNGQVYFVHNRIKGIEAIQKKLRKLAPGAVIEVGHGRMPEKALEETMMRFIKGEIDVLVCTTIIESGIDIPNANTLIINRADMFGLADLYQLRGRVGRFNRKAYAYLLLPKKFVLGKDIQRRMTAIKKYRDLGSGFKVAMEDLQIRGAGNLLGLEQHGYIHAIGFDLYCRLLKHSIEIIKKGM
ncbi:MAG: transcription-repair coupling factor [Candidatus Omnitrophota bacterium]